MEELYQKYKQMIYGIALTRVRQPADAEDITSDVIVTYLRAHPVFENEAHEKAWFIRATLHRTANTLMTAWRRHNIPRSEPPGSDGGERIDSDLHAAMLSLPAQTRILLYLFHYEKMDIDSIARCMKLSPAAVKKRLTRGRDALRAILGDE